MAHDNPSPDNDFDVIVVGGGLAGLCAAYRLVTRGVKRVALLEAEDALGGNAQSGGDCPRGAGYVPVPTRRSKLYEFAALLRDLGIGARHVVRPPVERLYDAEAGRWRRVDADHGVAPVEAMGAEERREYGRFRRDMARRAGLVGRDGRRAFALPVAACSRDAAFVADDALSAEAWLDREGYVGAKLRWFVDYCVRDDYGTALRDCSAWVMLHYFCARDGDALYAFPDGLGAVVAALETRLRAAGCAIRRGVRVATISADGDGVRVASEAGAYVAERVVCALPRRVAAAVVDGAPADDRRYAPWVVATVRTPAVDDRCAWDTVVYRGGAGAPGWFSAAALGFVSSAHFRRRRPCLPRPRPAALTLYAAFADGDEDAARARLAAAPRDELARLATAEVAAAHPKGLAVDGVDVRVLPYAMAKPTPGLLGGVFAPRGDALGGRVVFGHSDASLPLFEEAHYWGTTAADAVCRARGDAGAVFRLEAP